MSRGFRVMLISLIIYVSSQQMLSSLSSLEALEKACPCSLSSPHFPFSHSSWAAFQLIPSFAWQRSPLPSLEFLSHSLDLLQNDVLSLPIQCRYSILFITLPFPTVTKLQSCDISPFSICFSVFLKSPLFVSTKCSSTTASWLISFSRVSNSQEHLA